jgi:hypothetical protein
MFFAFLPCSSCSFLKFVYSALPNSVKSDFYYYYFELRRGNYESIERHSNPRIKQEIRILNSDMDCKNQGNDEISEIQKGLEK